MGSYQYVLSNKQLLVFVHVKNGANPAASMCASCDTTTDDVPMASGDNDQPIKKLYACDDSFSVSKI
jgi:hypothetical protein